MPKHKIYAEHRDFARSQRREMTRAESLLWNVLRGGRLEGYTFKRQVPFGPYGADFACAAAVLVVEPDGAPHGDPERKERDRLRDLWFGARGFTVLRIRNDPVLASLEPAVEAIRRALHAPSPGSLRSPPSPSRGEGRSAP